MNFLARDEANSLEKALRRQIADQPRPKRVLYYEGGASRDYSRAANAITASIGEFTEASFCYSRTMIGWKSIAALSGGGLPKS
jgi:hypothetical protein